MLDKTIDMCAIVVTSHELQDLLTRMLEGDIEVGEEVPELRELVEMRESECVWVEIVDAEGRMLECWSVRMLDKLLDRLIDRTEHIHQARLTIEIRPVARRILREYLDLADTLCEHHFHFFDDRLDRTRCLATADRRDDAEGTVVITSLRDFQILIAKWRMHIRAHFISSPDECFLAFSWCFDRCEIVREGFFFGLFMCLFGFYYGSEIEF
jgi:hypothetical protein